MSGYRVSNQFDRAKKVKAINTLKRLVKAGKNTNQIQTELRAEGLGYRRENLQHDIRRYKAFKDSTTPDRRAANKRWFDTVFEPFRDDRKKRGWSNREINEFWERAKTQSYDNLTEAERDEVLALREMYSKKFEGYVSA